MVAEGLPDVKRVFENTCGAIALVPLIVMVGVATACAEVFGTLGLMPERGTRPSNE